MDAQQSTFRGKGFMRPLVARIVAVWLAAVLAVGLWQGYGVWLLDSGVGDVF